MAKSIYQQLIEGQADVDHNGETLTGVELPQWMKDIGTVLVQGLDKAEEQAEVFDVLEANNMFDGFMALALQQAVVGFRAMVRPADTPGELKGELTKVSIIADDEAARERGLAYLPKSLSRPKTALTLEQGLAEIIKALQAKGKSQEEIIALMTKG